MIFFSNWVIPYQGGCYQCLVTSNKFHSSICDWNYECFTTFRQYHLFRVESFSMDFWCVHLFQLLEVHNESVSFPDSSRVQYVTKEKSREHFLAKLMDSWLIRRGYRMIFNQWTKWNDRSFKRLFKSTFGCCFPIRQSLLNVFADSSSIPWNPPTISSRPDCEQYSICPSLSLRTALSAIRFVSERWGADMQWFHEENLHWLCQTPRNCYRKCFLVT